MSSREGRGWNQHLCPPPKLLVGGLQAQPCRCLGGWGVFLPVTLPLGMMTPPHSSSRRGQDSPAPLPWRDRNTKSQSTGVGGVMEAPP